VQLGRVLWNPHNSRTVVEPIFDNVFLGGEHARGGSDVAPGDQVKCRPLATLIFFIFLLNRTSILSDCQFHLAARAIRQQRV
jgi:hypothetical protein